MGITPEDRKLIVAALVVIFGGNIGSVINATNPNSRADPFTGTDAHGMERDILERTERERNALRRDILATVRQENYVNERECEKSKQAIRDRLSIVEQNQKHCVERLRIHERVGQ